MNKQYFGKNDSSLCCWEKKIDWNKSVDSEWTQTANIDAFRMFFCVCRGCFIECHFQLRFFSSYPFIVVWPSFLLMPLSLPPFFTLLGVLNSFYRNKVNCFASKLLRLGTSWSFIRSNVVLCMCVRPDGTKDHHQTS